jgi:hypothetical protein
MKKMLLSPVLLALTSLPALAQLPVSTTAQNRKVVLEEFTGIHCQFCSDGHKLANDLKAAKPAGDVILVNIHTGGYATPSAGEPDYRTSEGAAIASISGMNITGYPTGSINRHTFGSEAGFAVSRSRWNSYAAQTLALPSYANVALQAELDTTTRILTVKTETYFTAAGTANNKLTVVLLEDNVHGPQVSGATYYPAMMNSDGTYTHNHMLRKVLTATSVGDDLSPTTKNSKVTKKYTYTIPAQYVNRAPNMKNLRLAAFVAEGVSEIVTGAYGPIKLTNKPSGIADMPSFASSVVLAPNPATAQATLTLSLTQGTKLSVQVMDMTGRVVNQIAEQNLSAGMHTFPIATDNLAAGVYNVRIATAEGVVTQRLSVVK